MYVYIHVHMCINTCMYLYVVVIVCVFRTRLGQSRLGQFKHFDQEALPGSFEASHCVGTTTPSMEAISAMVHVSGTT